VAEVKAPKQMLREILSLRGRRRHQHDRQMGQKAAAEVRSLMKA
jgi:hypothetical protein